MAGSGAVLRDSLMAFSVAFQSFPDAYPPIRSFVSPDVTVKEQAGLFPQGTSARYQEFFAQTLEQQRSALAGEEGRNIVKALVDILNESTDTPQLTASLVVALDGSVVDEKTNIDHLMKVHKHPKQPVNVITLLNRLIVPEAMAQGDVIVAAATHLLAAFLSELAIRPGLENVTERVYGLVTHLIQMSE
jgi:hypothetical protein